MPFTNQKLYETMTEAPEFSDNMSSDISSFLSHLLICWRKKMQNLILLPKVLTDLLQDLIYLKRKMHGRVF